MYADIFWYDTSSRGATCKRCTTWNNFKLYDGCNYTFLTINNYAQKSRKPKLIWIFIVICAIGIVIVGYFFNKIQYLLVQKNVRKKEIEIMSLFRKKKEEKEMVKEQSNCTCGGTCNEEKC